jgi:hypothetical protein
VNKPTGGGQRPTSCRPLLHRAVRPAVSHTGRGECSPHTGTSKTSQHFAQPQRHRLAVTHGRQNAKHTTRHTLTLRPDALFGAQTPPLRAAAVVGAAAGALGATAWHCRRPLANPAAPLWWRGPLRPGGPSKPRRRPLCGARRRLLRAPNRRWASTQPTHAPPCALLQLASTA